MQTDDVLKRGGALMEKEDIMFLLSLPGIQSGEVRSFEVEENYNSEELFRAIASSKDAGLKGIKLSWGTLTREDESKVQAMGYLINPTGHGSVLWDEIYFSEEAFIENHISHFKNMFESFTSIAHFV